MTLVPSELLTLRLFVTVCEERSISRAARRENIAASALSRRLSDLEERYRVALFRRHARGLEATQAGLALLHHARILMRDVAQMNTEMNEHAAGLKGRVLVRANVWAIVQYLPKHLTTFLARHPLVTLQIEEALSAATVEAVAGRAADLGIIGGNVPAPGLRVLPYRKDRLVVVLPPDHPLARRPSLRLLDLVPYDFVGSQRGSAVDRLVMQAAAAIGETLRVRIRVSGPETMCRMAEARMGVGLVPEECAARHCNAMALAMVPLAEDWALRELKLCVARGDLLPQVTMFMDHLQQSC
jgi:DNA-binding transcriptional LysR family regulator